MGAIYKGHDNAYSLWWRGGKIVLVPVGNKGHDPTNAKREQKERGGKKKKLF